MSPLYVSPVVSPACLPCLSPCVSLCAPPLVEQLSMYLPIYLPVHLPRSSSSLCISPYISLCTSPGRTARGGARQGRRHDHGARGQGEIQRDMGEIWGRYREIYGDVGVDGMITALEAKAHGSYLPISPLYLPYFCPASERRTASAATLYHPHISPISPLYLPGARPQ